jgi:hypothetical protein
MDTMTLTLLCLAASLFTLALVIGARALDRYAWHRGLRAWQLELPRSLTVEEAVRWLSKLAAATHPPRWTLLPLAPIALEVVARPDGITHYVLAAAPAGDMLLASVRAQMPGARLTEVPLEMLTPPRLTVACELTTTSQTRPLASDQAEVVSASLLATLQPLEPGERLITQLLLVSAGTPPPAGAATATATSEPAVRPTVTPDAVQAARDKQRAPLLAATLRLGVTAPTRQRANALLERAWTMTQGLNAPGVCLVRRLLPSGLCAARLRTRHYALLRWPLLLNVGEAVGLTCLPFDATLPGLTPSRARQLPPPPNLPTSGAVVGRCTYPGLAARPLALAPSDRLRHLHLIGPTGSGKSTLLAQLVLQDIAAGHGVVVIDPKGDLVNDIAARVPTERCPEVVILDPSELQPAAVGFNPLAAPSAGMDISRELIADHVLAIFHSIYEEFWGPRTDEILRAALFSLTHTTAPDGAAFTLIEVPELLTNPTLRRYVSRHPDLPPSVRSFWEWFDGALSDAARVDAIGPVLNKLRAFSMRSSIRLLLGQSQGLALGHHLTAGGVLLISLAKGKIGGEAANLLGSLFVATLWQATQARVALPADQRRPVFAYLDEFQDIVRLGAEDNLADMLAQARGLGLSLTLAHQYLNQLPATVRDATLGTVRTHIAFQLEWDDARALEARFAPLSRDDLSGLSAFEFALKPCVDGVTLLPVTGATLPLGAPLQDAAALARASRERYGLPRTVIEAGLQARREVIPTGPAGGRFGREAAGERL